MRTFLRRITALEGPSRGPNAAFLEVDMSRLNEHDIERLRSIKERLDLGELTFSAMSLDDLRFFAGVPMKGKTQT